MTTARPAGFHDDTVIARALAMALPNAGFVEVPGNHMSAVTLPQLGDAIADWF